MSRATLVTERRLKPRVANGRELNYTYNTGLDTTISHVSALTDHSTGTTLEGYSYLGVASIIQRSHPETGVGTSTLAFCHRARKTGQ